MSEHPSNTCHTCGSPALSYSVERDAGGVLVCEMTCLNRHRWAVSMPDPSSEPPATERSMEAAGQRSFFGEGDVTMPVVNLEPHEVGILVSIWMKHTPNLTVLAHDDGTILRAVWDRLPKHFFGLRQRSIHSVVEGGAKMISLPSPQDDETKWQGWMGEPVILVDPKGELENSAVINGYKGIPGSYIIRVC